MQCHRDRHVWAKLAHCFSKHSTFFVFRTVTLLWFVRLRVVLSHVQKQRAESCVVRGSFVRLPSREVMDVTVRSATTPTKCKVLFYSVLLHFYYCCCGYYIGKHLHFTANWNYGSWTQPMSSWETFSSCMQSLHFRLAINLNLRFIAFKWFDGLGPLCFYQFYLT